MDTAASLAPLDYVIIVAYLAAVVGIAVWVSRRVETGDDLFLAGRSLRWPVIGGSLFASNISSTTLIGLAGAAYTSGVAVSNYEWMAGVVLVFMAVFVIPVYLRARISTIPEYLEKRFDRRSRLYFSAATIALTVLVDTAGGVYAGAVVLRTFFPDLVLWQTCVALAVFAGLYTAAGGLKAVVYTDVIQTVVLIVGSTALTVIVFGEYGYSWAQARQAIPDDHLSLILPLDDETLPWLGTLVGVPVIGFWYWGANQYITQRILGSASVQDAQWGANLAALLKLTPLFIMVLPGAMAIGLYPDLENGDRVFPTLVAELLPVGLTGLVLAGLTAAIMSSIDSTLNSASTLVIKDFIERPGRELDPAAAGRYGRYVTLGLMAFAAVWAPQIAHFGGLFDYLQQAFSVLAPPVVAVFLMGLLTRRGSRRAPLATLAIGHALGLALFLATAFGLWPLHFTVNIGVMTAVSAVIYLLIDRRDGDAPASGDDLVWRRAFLAEAMDHAPRANPLYQGAAVLAATLAMVVWFW